MFVSGLGTPRPLLCIVLIVLFTVYASGQSCEPLKQVLSSKNITINQNTQPLTQKNPCGRDTPCCNGSLLVGLEDAVASDLRSLVHQHLQSSLGPFVSATANIKHELKSLWAKSENETAGLLWETGESGLEATRKLYQSLWNSLLWSGSTDSFGEELLRWYFRELFPSIYLGVVHVGGRRASVHYHECLLRQGAGRLGSSAEAVGKLAGSAIPRTRALLQASVLAASAVHVTTRKLDPSPSCRAALTSLTYCSSCLDLPPVKPCSGYCLNVMRGCLSNHEPDLPWQNFLIELEVFLKDLLRDQESGILSFLSSIPSAVSDALIIARVNGPAIEKELKRLCGSLKPDNSTKKQVPLKMNPETVNNDLSDSKKYNQAVGWLLSAVENSRTKGFYSSLPETICSDETFAESKDSDHCWNGNRIAEYTKPLVGPGSDAQKYNPEVAWTKPSEDSEIRHLSEQLRYMAKELGDLVLKSRIPASDSLMLEREGSGGSGAGPWRPGDDEDDEDGWSGSGSGDHPVHYEPDQAVDFKSRSNRPVMLSPIDSNDVARGQETRGVSTSVRQVGETLVILFTAVFLFLLNH